MKVMKQYRALWRPKNKGAMMFAFGWRKHLFFPSSLHKYAQLTFVRAMHA